MLTRMKGNWWLRILEGRHEVNGNSVDYHIDPAARQVDITDGTTVHRLAQAAFEAGFTCGAADAARRMIPVLTDLDWLEDEPKR